MSNIIKELFIRGKVFFVFAKIIGSMFCLTLGLLALGLFVVAVAHIVQTKDFFQIEILTVLFEAIGLVAVAVAVLELALTIFREIIIREVEKRHPSQFRRTLTRFGIIIIIAILIEGFIMIFKFSKAGQIHLLPYAILTLGGATLLMLGIVVYLRMTIPLEKHIELTE